MRILGFIISLFPISLSHNVLPFLVVWNVGQGQFVTAVETHRCLHFDFGGEWWPTEVLKMCGGKSNELYLSHWDTDHLNFAYRFKKLAILCKHKLPQGNPSDHKRKMMASIKDCGTDRPSVDDVYSHVTKMNFHSPSRTANGLSDVYLYKDVLIPGDSPQKAERVWVKQLSQAVRARILILGHHGSRTSTSYELLESLTHLRLSVASQRRSRYGHPHADVLAKLRLRGTPLLLTEDWGHIKIQMR